MGRISAAINAYVAQNADRYHTPGHKGVLCVGDITELGVSGQWFPADALTKAQTDTAALYGVACMHYLTGGSSMGIKAALWCFRKQKVLYAAGVHRAFFEGCELAGIEAVPVSSRGESDADGKVFTCGCDALPPPLDLAAAEQALNRHPDARALFVTSPDYLGRTADRRIAALCKQRGVAILADAAHGAHFAFAPDLNALRWETVADMANMSAHKTLGAYTQTALLAVQNKALANEAAHALALLGTTSPNYPMLAQLEDSVAAAAAHTAEYARLRDFSQNLHECADILPNSDYTRLCVRPRKYDARQAFARLAAEGIMAEAVIEDRVVFIVTPYDNDEKLARLRQALQTI